MHGNKSGCLCNSTKERKNKVGHQAGEPCTLSLNQMLLYGKLLQDLSRCLYSKRLEEPGYGGGWDDLMPYV